jgi:DNA-binding NarL/FixJ family response regulator
MKCLLVDDHHLIREALRGVLKELRREAAIIEAATGAEALRFVEEHPDIGMVLLDLTLPDRDGLVILRELRQSHPAMSVVVLSAAQDRSNVMKALDLGASGFIPKSASREVMLSALQLVLAGGVYIPPQILQRETGAEAATLVPGPWCAELGLTGRQLDVLALMMQGKNNKTICRTLNLAEPTVKNHVSSILKALKVSNRTEAVIAINRLGSVTSVKP